MEKIIFEAQTKKPTKTKRHSIIVTDETYLRIIEINCATGIPVEKIVNRLLEEALKNVEIQERGGEKDK